MKTSSSWSSPRFNFGNTFWDYYIYINDLSNKPKSNVQLLADDVSLFTIVKYINESASALNNDLSLISKWAFNWKMLYHPDPRKPAQEVLFSRNKKLQIHLTISLNNIQVERASYQKHLGILLDEKLNFKEHVDSTIVKVNKGV